jgi:hypothetical protein
MLLEQDSGHNEKAARIFLVALLLATILNGSVLWLKRVGILEPQLRQTFNRTYRLESQAGMSPEKIEDLRAKEHDLFVQLFRPVGSEVVFKIAKDIVIGLFLLFSLWRLLRHPSSFRTGDDWPALAILSLLIIFFVASVQRNGWIPSLVGLRPFSFLFIALVGSWAASREGFVFLSKGLFALVLFQVLLLPVELARGIPLFHATFLGTPYGDRVVGTMLLPSSLGIVAVFSLVFYYCFSESRLRLGIFVAVVTALIYFSASGTAWIILFLCLLALAFEQIKPRKKKWIAMGGAGCILLLLVVLPNLVGRGDVYDSLLGRVRGIEKYWTSNDNVVELVVGRGLGIGANVARNLRTYSDAFEGRMGQRRYYRSATDSTPMALLHQVGIVGLMLFYLLIGYAARKDPPLRLPYLVLVIASMTINLTEFFPLNVILGLLLARSLTVTHGNTAELTHGTRKNTDSAGPHGSMPAQTRYLRVVRVP